MNSMEFGPPSPLFRTVHGRSNETVVCEFQPGSGGPGGRFVFLSIVGLEAQRIYLDAVGQRFPLSYDGNKLDVFLPFREGQPFFVWERDTRPGCQERRLVCLQILQGLLEDRVPGALFVKMLARENICLCREGARLQYFLDFSEKRGLRLSAAPSELETGAPLSAYSELAAFFFELLNDAVGMTPDNAARCPPEYRLLWERAVRREYHTPDQLFRDLSALPEDFSLRRPVFSLLRRGKEGLNRLPRRMAGVILLLLAAAAVFCVAAAAMRRLEPTEGDEPFGGMLQIGDQILNEE